MSEIFIRYTITGLPFIAVLQRHFWQAKERYISNQPVKSVSIPYGNYFQKHTIPFFPDFNYLNGKQSRSTAREYLEYPQ